MTVLRVRNIFERFAGCKGEATRQLNYTILVKFTNLIKLKINSIQMNPKLKHMHTKFGVKLLPYS